MNKTDKDVSVPKNVQLYAEDSSGQLIAIKSDLSGQLSVDVTIGDIIAVISGDVTATIYSAEVHIMSGEVTLASGGLIKGFIGISSGFISIQSGSVSISSGSLGAQVSGAVIISGNVAILSGLIGVTSGEVHILSGQLIAKISGETISITSGNIISIARESLLVSGYSPQIASGQPAHLVTDTYGRLWTLFTPGQIENMSGLISIIGFVQGDIPVTYDSGTFAPIRLDINGNVSTISNSGQEIIWRGVTVSGSVIISGNVAVLSGLIGITSGEVHIISGQLIAKTSGEITSVASGAVINRELLSGVFIASGIGVVATVTTNISGNIVSVLKTGVSNTLFSGYAATNTYVYSGFGFLTYDKATIMIKCLEQGSGVSYCIRGQPVADVLTHVFTSGQLVSGQQVVESISDPYAWVDVGVENTVDNYTGVVTIVTARK